MLKIWAKYCQLLFGLLILPSLCFGNSYLDYQKAVKSLIGPEPKSSIMSIASGFGAKSGDLFIAVSYSDKDLQTEIEKDDDGSIVAGLGFGDPWENMGIEVAVGITSVSTAWWGDGKFGDEGNINLKFHKIVNPFWGDVASLSLGASNLLGWGGTQENSSNLYSAFSEQSVVGQFYEYNFSYTVGYGTAVSNKETDNDFFGGLALGKSNLSGSLSVIGNEFHTAATFYVPYLDGLTLSITNVGAFGDPKNSRNIFTLGYVKVL